jgi:hypothetical protein
MNRIVLSSVALACLLTACAPEPAGVDDIDDMEDLGSQSSELTAQPGQITSLISAPAAMQLRYTVADPNATRIGVLRMDREQGYYRRVSGSVPTPSHQYSFDDAAVVLGHEYCYVIVTYAAGQSRGTNSEVRCAVHTGGPTVQPPTGLRVDDAYERGLRLAFEDASSDETSFSIERRSGLTWSTVATLPAGTGTGTTVTWSDSDLDLEQSYCYRARAQGANGSSISNTVCGTTLPLAVTDPVPSDRPLPITITHPQPGTLLLSWIDVAGENEWTVYRYPGFSYEAESVSSVQDHQTPPATHHAVRQERLSPGMLYCFVVMRGQGPSSYRRLCATPTAERSDDPSERDPRPELTPSITGVSAPSNGVLEVAIANPQPGQVLERIVADNSERNTLLEDAAGADHLSDPGLDAGKSYCYRLWVYNPFGARYSNLMCGTTTADAIDPLPISVTYRR